MRTVVTGGSGFIGSNIVDALLERGDQVLVIDDLSTGRIENLDQAQKRHGSAVRFSQMNVCDPKIKDEFAAFKPDIVFHEAAQMNVRRSVVEPVFDANTNVLGSVNLLEACKESGVRGFIFASTGGAIYGEQEYFPAKEDHPSRAECPYGVAKRAAELYIEYFARVYNFTGVALRYANVYGPRQNPKGEAGVVAIFCERILSGQPLKVNGDGLQTRDYVFVRDVIDANLRASTLERPGKFSVFNVGTGIESTVLDLAHELKRDWESRNKDAASVKIEHGPALPGEQRRSVVDASKLKAELSWEDQVRLREGLAETLGFFENARR